MTAANLLTNLITERLLERALKLQRIINSKRLKHSQVFCLMTGATSEKTGSYQDGLETKRRPVESRKGKRVGMFDFNRRPACPVMPLPEDQEERPPLTVTNGKKIKLSTDQPSKPTMERKCEIKAR